MARRPSFTSICTCGHHQPFGGCGCHSGNVVLVDKVIGTAYDVVRVVAESLLQIRHVSANLETVHYISEKMDEINAVFARITELEDLSLNLTKLLEVHDDLALLTELHTNLGQLQTLHSDLAALVDLHNNLQELLDVQQDLTALNTIHTNLAELLAIQGNMSNLTLLATNLPLLQELVDNAAAVVAAGENVDSLVNLNNNIAVIEEAVDNIATLESVANNITAITAVNDGLAAINTVEINLAMLTDIHDRVDEIALAHPDWNTEPRIIRQISGVGANDMADSTAFDSYIGAPREITVDQTRGIIAVHDGLTPGGLQLNPGGGGGGTNFTMISESFTGLVGANQVYELQERPIIPENVLVFIAGVRQRPTIDYTVSGRNLTILSNPEGHDVDTQLLAGPYSITTLQGKIAADFALQTNLVALENDHDDLVQRTLDLESRMITLEDNFSALGTISTHNLIISPTEPAEGEEGDIWMQVPEE